MQQRLYARRAEVELSANDIVLSQYWDLVEYLLAHLGTGVGPWMAIKENEWRGLARGGIFSPPGE